MRSSFAALSCMSTKHAGTWAKKGEGLSHLPSGGVLFWRMSQAPGRRTRRVFAVTVGGGVTSSPLDIHDNPSHSHVKSTKGDTVTCGTLSVVNPPCLSLGIGRDDANFGLFGGSCGWVVAPPPWRRGPQVRAPWHHGGHGAVDVVGPVAPPGHACGCGNAGVYTDRRKWALGAVLGHLCTLLRRGLGLWVALGSQ